MNDWLAASSTEEPLRRVVREVRIQAILDETRNRLRLLVPQSSDWDACLSTMDEQLSALLVVGSKEPRTWEQWQETL